MKERKKERRGEKREMRKPSTDALDYPGWGTLSEMFLNRASFSFSEAASTCAISQGQRKPIASIPLFVLHN